MPTRTLGHFGFSNARAPRGWILAYYATLSEETPWTCSTPLITALLKVDFGSRSQSRVPDFYSTFVKKSTLLDFNSGKSDLDSTPPWRSTPSPKPYLGSNRRTPILLLHPYDLIIFQLKALLYLLKEPWFLKDVMDTCFDRIITRFTPVYTMDIATTLRVEFQDK